MVSLAGELLSKAEALLREGLHVTEVIDGYAKALGQVGALRRFGGGSMKVHG